LNLLNRFGDAQGTTGALGIFLRFVLGASD
jgi:hypothetical protein